MRPGWEAVLMKMRYHNGVPDLKKNEKFSNLDLTNGKMMLN